MQHEFARKEAERTLEGAGDPSEHQIDYEASTLQMRRPCNPDEIRELLER